MKKALFTLSLTLLVLNICLSQTLVVNNVLAKKDTNGKIVDIHDGNLLAANNQFYLYGSAYGNTNGFTKSNTFECYSSSDLSVWKKSTLTLLKNAPSGIYYRPKVIYNARTKKYVLWFNWYPELWEGKYGVAVSDNPEGPFEILNTDLKIGNKEVGDFSLMVDEDKSAYIVYNTIAGHKIFVEKLNEDYTASSLIISSEIDNDCEAPAMFKRGKYYYILTDKTCCFCGEGTGAKVLMSTNPLSGYMYKGNINRYNGKIRYSANDGNKDTREGVAISGAQAAEVVLPNKAAIDNIKLTVANSRFVSHCISDENGKVIANGPLPAFQLSYKNNNNKWVYINLPKPTITNEYLTYKSFNFKMPSTYTDRIKIQTSDIPYNQQVILSEVEVYKGGKNLALAANHSIVIESKSDTIERNNYEFPIIIPAQQTYVSTIHTEKEDLFIWMGDMWGSREDGIKGHDFQYWYPLSFDADGLILPMKWMDKWSFKIK